MQTTSALAAALLVSLAFTNATLHLYSVEVGFDGDSVYVHPTWLARVDRDSIWLRGSQGIGLFNVAIVGYGTGEPEWFVVKHEIVHTQQFRALGWWMVPLYLADNAVGSQLFNFEGNMGVDYWDEWLNSPSSWYTGWYADALRDSLDAMWSPPEGWQPRWSFLTVSLRR